MRLPEIEAAQIWVAIMKKSESEPTLRHLCHQWREERNHPLPGHSDMHYSFSDFKTWLREKGHSHYLDFRSVMGADEDAERWFDQEMRQTWRN